jgi:myosin heavy subunit
MIDPSDGKEIKKDYLDTLEALLKKIFQKAKEKEYKPDKQILIKVGQENVYKGVPDENIKYINPLISQDLVDKLEKAFNNPEKLKNVVSIRIGRAEVFRIQDGETKVDKLGLSQAVKQTQKNATREPVYSLEALQKQVDVLHKKMQEQQKLVDELKTKPQSSESITKLFAQVEEMSNSLEKQQKAIEKTQQSLAAFNQHSLPRFQNTKLQDWVGGIENKVKQTSKNLFERVKDALTPEIVKLRNSVDKQMSEMKSQVNQQVSTLQSEMQTQIEGVKSQVTTSINNVRENVDNKIETVQGAIQDTRQEVANTVSFVKQKAIEESVKALLNALGQKNLDGSITFKSKNFDFEQLGNSVNVKAKNGAGVIKDGFITPEVTPEQITQLEKVQPVVDELLSAQADLEYAEAEEEYIQAESEYLDDPESIDESENLSRGMSR